MAALDSRDLGAALELAEEAKKVGKEGVDGELAKPSPPRWGRRLAPRVAPATDAADVAAARYALALAARPRSSTATRRPAHRRSDAHQDAHAA